MLELIGQALAYSGVGLAVLVAGYYMMDLLTPGHLGHHVAQGNANAAILVCATLVSLGLIEFFAIFFTGAGWRGLDDAAVFGAIGVLAQVVGFFVLEALIPGKLSALVVRERFHPAAAVAAAVQLAVALVVCASLT